MTITIHRETATIIPFPKRPRVRLVNGSTPQPAQTPRDGATMAPHVVYDCWYHEDALHETPTPPDRPKPC